MIDRASKAIVTARVESLIRPRLAGLQWWDVRDYVVAQQNVVGSPWHVPDGAKGMSDTQLRRYIGKADNLIQRLRERSRKRSFGNHLAKCRHLYAQAIKAGDLRAALAALKAEAKLLDLYPRPEDELRREVAELRRMLEQDGRADEHAEREA